MLSLWWHLLGQGASSHSVDILLDVSQYFLTIRVRHELQAGENPIVVYWLKIIVFSLQFPTSINWCFKPVVSFCPCCRRTLETSCRRLPLDGGRCREQSWAWNCTELPCPSYECHLTYGAIFGHFNRNFITVWSRWSKSHNLNYVFWRNEYLKQLRGGNSLPNKLSSS